MAAAQQQQQQQRVCVLLSIYVIASLSLSIEKKIVPVCCRRPSRFVDARLCVLLLVLLKRIAPFPLLLQCFQFVCVCVCVCVCVTSAFCFK